MNKNTIIYNSINLNDLKIDPSITGLFAYTSEELYDYATAPRLNGFKYAVDFCENAACEIINRIKERAEYIINEEIYFEAYDDSALYVNETIRSASDFIIDNYDEMTECEIDEYLKELEKDIARTLLSDAIARSNHDEDDGDDECWEDDEEEFDDDEDDDDCWEDDEEEFDDDEDSDDECWEDDEEEFDDDECWKCNESGFWDTFDEDFFDDNGLPKQNLSDNSNRFFNNTFAQICPFFYETLMNGVDDMIFFKRANSSDELFKIFGEEIALFSKKLYMNYLE